MLDLTPQPVFLTIKGRNWTPWLQSFTIGWDEFDLKKGVVRVSGTVTITLGRSLFPYPTSPDTRANASEWDRGVLITIMVGSQPLPAAGNALYILNRPAPAHGIEQSLSIAVGDIFTLRSFVQANPEENITNVLFQPQSRASVVGLVLSKASISSSTLSIPGTIDFPYNKISGGLVDFAGQLTAITRRILCVDQDGIVLAKQLLPAGLAIGSFNYVEFAPVSDFSFIGAERFFARSIIYDVKPIIFNTFNQHLSSRFALFGQGSVNNLIVWKTERITNNVTSFSEVEVTTTETIRGVIDGSNFPGSTFLITSEVKTETRIFNNDGILDSVTISKSIPLFLIDPDQFPFNFSLAEVEIKTTTYSYDRGLVTGFIETTELPRRLIFNVETNSLNIFSVSEKVITSFQPVGRRWKKTVTKQLPLGIAYPERITPIDANGQGGFRLVIVSSQSTESDSPPPAPIRRTPVFNIEEVPIEVLITQPQPINDSHPRTQDIFIEFATSVSQLEDWAKDYLFLTNCRNNGWFVTIPYVRLFPGDVLNVNDFGFRYKLMCDAITYHYKPDQLTVSFTGLTLEEERNGIIYEANVLTSVNIQTPSAYIGISVTEITHGDATPIVVSINTYKPVVGNQNVQVVASGDLNVLDILPPAIVVIPNGSSHVEFNLVLSGSPIAGTVELTLVKPSNKLRIGFPSKVVLTVLN